MAVTAIVRFALPEGKTREAATAAFEASAPLYRGVQGLIRKYYLLSEDGRTGGGVYLFNSREDAEGLENKAIVERLGADANTVGKWRRRFAERRLDGLYDEPRSGAPRKIGDERIAEIIGRTLEETPPDGTHWSLRSMARAVGYAPSTIHRIWQAFGLQPVAST